MKIAVIAWGSIIHDPRELNLVGNWKPGPDLKVEFSRVSDDKRLTLVVDMKHGSIVPTQYKLSGLPTVEEARANLRERETNPKTKKRPLLRSIGYVCRTGENWEHSAYDSEIDAEQNNHSAACRVIEHWLRDNGLDAAVWTALPPKFTALRFNVPNATNYVINLPAEKRNEAFDYVKNAPPQISTRVRRSIERRRPYKDFLAKGNLTKA